ncbi:uncharacterized protein LOC143268403 isoform X1 [Peromyscus maniculatus bairdii]|uniref:uncharacterized protein LOC143268403 isoform X1 n=1 Tax=Peromyscus maniculatus bairdii TaxID=230844 RepID=UPI003FD1C883
MRIRDPAGERAPAARLVAPGSPLPHLLPRVRLTDADPSRTAALGTPPPGLTQNDVLLGRWEGLAVVLRHPLTKPSHRRSTLNNKQQCRLFPSFPVPSLDKQEFLQLCLYQQTRRITAATVAAYR